MNTLLTISGSNHSRSIHAELLQLLQSKYNVAFNILPVDEMDLPLFDLDLNFEIGIPKDIQAIHAAIQKADQILFTAPEHNGAVTAFQKSMLDWLSRAELKFLTGKKIFIIGTSKGYGGAQHAIDNLTFFVKRFGASEVHTLSIPSYGFLTQENGDLLEEVDAKINSFISKF